jgi:hypothetical protein
MGPVAVNRRVLGFVFVKVDAEQVDQGWREYDVAGGGRARRGPMRGKGWNVTTIVLNNRWYAILRRQRTRVLGEREASALVDRLRALCEPGCICSRHPYQHGADRRWR